MSDIVQIEWIHALALGLPSIIAAVLSYMGLRQSVKISNQTSSLAGKVEENHNQVNGRMEQLLDLTGKAGEAIGEQREKDRKK
jgi:hypothetical protein